MDPFDDRTEGLVRADAERIIAQDPRVILLDLRVDLNSTDQSITIPIKVKYTEVNIEDNLVFTFKDRNR